MWWGGGREGEIDGGGEGDKGKVCFLSKAKETLMVNLAPKQINMTPKQTALLCSALLSSLTVRVREIFKEAFFYERPTMKNIVVVEGRGGESEEERLWDDGVRNGEGWKGIYRGNGCLGCIYP